MPQPRRPEPPPPPAPTAPPELEQLLTAYGQASYLLREVKKGDRGYATRYADVEKARAALATFYVNAEKARRAEVASLASRQALVEHVRQAMWESVSGPLGGPFRADAVIAYRRACRRFAEQLATGHPGVTEEALAALQVDQQRAWKAADPSRHHYPHGWPTPIMPKDAATYAYDPCVRKEERTEASAPAASR